MIPNRIFICEGALIRRADVAFLPYDCLLSDQFLFYEFYQSYLVANFSLLTARPSSEFINQR